MEEALDEVWAQTLIQPSYGTTGISRKHISLRSRSQSWAIFKCRGSTKDLWVRYFASWLVCWRTGSGQMFPQWATSFKYVSGRQWLYRRHLWTVCVWRRDLAHHNPLHWPTWLDECEWGDDDWQTVRLIPALLRVFAPANLLCPLRRGPGYGSIDIPFSHCMGLTTDPTPQPSPSKSTMMSRACTGVVRKLFPPWSLCRNTAFESANGDFSLSSWAHRFIGLVATGWV